MKGTGLSLYQQISFKYKQIYIRYPKTGISRSCIIVNNSNQTNNRQDQINITHMDYDANSKSLEKPIRNIDFRLKVISEDYKKKEDVIFSHLFLLDIDLILSFILLILGESQKH